MTVSEVATNGTPDAVAVTKEEDSQLLPASTGLPSNLPNEVLLMVFKPLSKEVLKSVRRACKFFETLVSPLLFDEIYISPHRRNLDVFRHISEHPHLCRYPRKLIYDILKFKANIDPQEYYKDLCNQLGCLYANMSRFSIHHVDKDIEGLVRMIRGPSDEYKKDYSTWRVVRRGLEIYREQAEDEDHYNNSGQLLAYLCFGLMKMPYLDKVEIQDGWSNGRLRSVDGSKRLQGFHMFSGPLARAWNPFHLKPKVPWNDATIVHEFDNVISAFSVTKRPLRALDVSFPGSVPYEKFNTSSCLSRTFRQHGLAAMHHLESLKLQVYMLPYPSKRESSDTNVKRTLSVDLLGAALLHMPGLRNLSLSATTRSDGNGWMSMSELFHAIRLPALTYLSLSSMFGSAADMLAFFRAQPRLRGLDLAFIELSEGTWVGLVDDMRRWLHLGSLDMGMPLRQGGGVDIWDEDAWDDNGVSDDVEHYVLYGGENPLRV